ncbi:MAG: hypothetical protein AAGD14_11150 [Planctomycetota bacterium]
MTKKARVSKRELWLISLLPSALVVILSLAIPGPADEIPEVEERLNRLTSSDAHARRHSQMRAFAKQLKESKAKQAELKSREAALKAELDAPPVPRAVRTLAMAEALDELTRRLAAHGVRLLAMEQSTSTASAPAKTSAARIRRARGGARKPSPGPVGSAEKPRSWQVSLAATWPAVRAALADPRTVPPGLALSALAMDPARLGVPLRRWELIVEDAGAAR